MRIFLKVSVKFSNFFVILLLFVHSLRKGMLLLKTLLFNKDEKMFLKFFSENQKNVLISNNFFERNRLLARLKALLITAACGDVVELVKSTYVQLSLIWSAGDPLHQAVSHFILFFFFGEKVNNKKLKSKKEKTKRNKNRKKGHL